MNSEQSAATISISNLCVKAGTRRLLDDAHAEFRAAEISIIVGASGVGKSVLLKIIAGLIKAGHDGITVSGSILADGSPIKSGEIGVVFQSFALFDELSPRGNLDFAKSCGNTKRTRQELEALLDELKVPLNVPTARLSGGQRQRLAIARTLAYDPPTILYDEPTSGLDPSTGIQVANLIRETHEQYHKTSIVVTHDYPALLPIADRVFLFNPIEGKINEVPKEKWEELGELLKPLSSAAAQDQEVAEPDTLVDRVGAMTKRFLLAQPRRSKHQQSACSG